MDLHNVSTFTKAETILNNPGKFFFQITEDNEIKMSNIPIHKKNVELIKTNIQLIFKKISENLRQISFIDPEYYNDVISKLEKYSNTSFSFRFPGLQVKSLGNTQLETVSKFPDRLLICEKSDGVRFLLIQFANDKTLFLGRNMEFFIVDLTVNLPKNTNYKKNEWDIEHFLDGELIIDKSNKNNIIKNHVLINNILHEVNFIVFDAVVLSGVNIGHLKFKHRLQELSNFFKKIKFQRFMEEAKEKFMINYKNYIHDSIKDAMNNIFDNNLNKSKKFSISLYMKDYFTFDKIEFLFSNICKNLNHDNDGIILNLDDYPYYSGAANEIFKWKPARLNTVDFELTIEKPNLNDRRLFVLNVNESRDKLIPMSCLFFENKEEEMKFLSEYEEIRLSPSRIIVECYYDNNFNTEETVNFNIMNHFEIIRKKNHLYLSNYDFNFIEEKRKLGINLNIFYTGAWKFLRFRRDKQQSNHISVFLNIWETITENLTIEKIISKIKTKYI
jgi:hypothetical protein